MQISQHRYRYITIGALVALAVSIVSGAAVRLTNSGLGCDDWPNCSNERFVDVSSKHAAIEQINRMFTGIVGIAVIAAVLGSFVRAGGRRRDLVRLSVLLVVGAYGLRCWQASAMRGNLILGALALQVSFGIGNVVMQLPLALAVAHNLGAAGLLGLLVVG